MTVIRDPSGLAVDTEQRRISIDRPVTARELYSALQDMFDEPDLMVDPSPMMAVTPQRFTMINDWRISGDDLGRITDGAIYNDAGVELKAPLPPPPPPLQRVYTRKQTLRKIIVRSRL